MTLSPNLLLPGPLDPANILLVEPVSIHRQPAFTASLHNTTAPILVNHVLLQFTHRTPYPLPSRRSYIQQNSSSLPRLPLEYSISLLIIATTPPAAPRAQFPCVTTHESRSVPTSFAALPETCSSLSSNWIPNSHSRQQLRLHQQTSRNSCLRTPLLLHFTAFTKLFTYPTYSSTPFLNS